MARRTPEQRALLEQLKHVARGLGETFAPFCEVVLHDLSSPKNSIVAIENNLSGRDVGDPTTELGLARIADSSVQQVIANYANRFADGRPVKSTSIGIKDANGAYVAALCLNIDLSLLHGLQHALARFGNVQGAAIAESLDPANADAIRTRIDGFAARRATTPRHLKTQDRRELVRELKAAGVMDLRRSADIVAQHLGVSRATVYSDAKQT
ncbi:MAG TPA: PAS domain-containing protein [Burkholderiaceae bacterium]|jgi:predicted transcriptional regulator YheO|nr:PAS domain-containing protein [Burkholderiaceae bacterium]